MSRHRRRNTLRAENSAEEAPHQICSISAEKQVGQRKAKGKEEKQRGEASGVGRRAHAHASRRR